MYGLTHWVRSFTYDKSGNIAKNANGPVFSAHPQPNNWTLIEANAKQYAQHFDLIQFPPAARGPGEGYNVTQLRSFESNWGQAQQLIAAIDASHEAGMLVAADFASRQMTGENGGPGVFKYPGGIGDTTPGWFQDFGQPGESKAAGFVAMDDVPNPSGNYSFGGRVRSLQHSNPKGAVIADDKGALAALVQLGFDRYRKDDGKGQWAPGVLEVLKSQPKHPAYVEYDSGNVGEIDWYVRDLMENYCAVEDYPDYWNGQRACNQYDARQFDAGGGGYWAKNSSRSVGFVNNPDVATSWSPTGGISQQIAFNLLLGYARAMFLPFETFLVYAEDYFPASPDFPTGRGFKPFLDNMLWFGKRYAVGNFERRWVDKDVYAYTRDGNGGSMGWSGGCLVALNFNTYNRRQMQVQTTWPDGHRVHNYSATGKNEYATIFGGGKLALDLQANSYSSGRSYQLWATA